MLLMLRSLARPPRKRRLTVRPGLRSTFILAAPLLVLTLLTLLTATPALAHRKTDVITLYNGDRITGDIKSLESGRLSFGTDAMGTVDIEWKEVASVDSNYNYEVRLGDGQRFFGSVKPASLPGSILVRDVFGERTLSWEEIVELRPVEDTIVDRLDVDVSANYAFTQASGVTQTELRVNASYEDENAQNVFTSRITIADTDEDSSASSRIRLARQVWTDRQAVYRVLFGGHETNDELGLDYRITFGGGLGRYFIDTNNSTLNAGFGLQALSERSADGSMQESVEAVLFGEFARWRFDTPEIDLTLDSQVYPSLTERGRVRADSNITLRWELISDLFWNASAWGSYDSSAVDDEAGEFDWGITTGVGWSF
jgi:hypothetical protein